MWEEALMDSRWDCQDQAFDAVAVLLQLGSKISNDLLRVGIVEEYYHVHIEGRVR
jgi:hypothetical protein